MSSIAVAYDGSDAAGRALARATELARLYDTTLVLTSVTPVLVDAASFPGPDADTLAHAERIRADGVTVEVVTAVGEPAQAIVEVAERSGASLIVVGTSEPSVVERMMGFSVSENVQRRARCDVLIVH
jgi:nucleotide-binding universal stress UspA family protein